MKFWLLVSIICIFRAGVTNAQQVTLDLYLQTARQNSPLLRQYKNIIKAAIIDSQIIRAGYKPQVALNAINMYAPSGNNFGYDASVTNGGQYGLIAGVTKAFASRYNLATQYKSVSLSADSVRALAAIAEQDISKNVTAQYLTAYGDQQQLIALAEIRELLVNEAKILKTLTQYNIYRQTDYLTFLVTQNQQELQLKQLRLQYLADFANLNYLCGIVDTGINGKTLLLPELKSPMLSDISSSIFYRQYEIDSLRLDNQVRLINISYRPKFGVFADAGYSTSVLGKFYRSFGASAGFSLSYPIYDGGKRKLTIHLVGLQEDSRLGYQAYFIKQHSQQLAGLRQQLSATEALRYDIEEQITYSKGLIEVNEKLLQTGDARIPDFVIAINNYLTAKTLLTQNRISRLQIINQINFWNR